MSPRALKELSLMPKGKPDDYALPFVGFGKAWARIKKQAGLEDLDHTIHDLRRSLSVELLTKKKAGIVQRQLNH